MQRLIWTVVLVGARIPAAAHDIVAAAATAAAQQQLQQQEEGWAISTPPAPPAFNISNVFGDNMVLQCNRPAPVWGWAPPGSHVHSTFVGVALSATATADGFWKLLLPAMPGELTEFELQVTCAAADDGAVLGQLVIRNLVFGHVVFCGGQSNMELTTAGAINGSAEIAASADYPFVRVTSGPEQNSDPLRHGSPWVHGESGPPEGYFAHTHAELTYMRLPWNRSSPESIGGDPKDPWNFFSAVCWFAIRDVFDALGGKIPVGGIAQSYGGTSIQYWMSADAIAASNAPIATQCCGQNGPASCLWNTQIHPYTLGPMEFTAVLWYQGEQNANCGGPTQVVGGVYSTMLQTMVFDWRAKFKQPHLAFGVVLLAAWKSGDLTSFPLLRVAQANISHHANHTFLISAIDQGDPLFGSVHSPYKQAVGSRAAAGVLAVALNYTNVTDLGPQYTRATAVADSGDGVVVVVTFAATGGPLVINSSVACPGSIPNSSCEAFAVLSAPDCVWRVAEAILRPAGAPFSVGLRPSKWFKNLTAVATRGYFANWPVVTVGNKAGIPAVPWLEYVSDSTKSKCSLLPPSLPTLPLALKGVATADPHAVCMDGSKPIYYMSPPKKGTNGTDKYQILLTGGYGFGYQSLPFCYPPPRSNWSITGGNCYWGDPAYPMPRATPPPSHLQRPCNADGYWGKSQAGNGCVYSTNCTVNPDFCNFGFILISSCNFDNWMGDTDRLLAGAGKVTLRWRGQRVLKVTLLQIAHDIKASSQTVIVMMGQEGGGTLLYSMADRIREFLGVAQANYFVVPVEGFWPRVIGVHSNDTLAQYIAGKNAPAWNGASGGPAQGGNVWEYMNFTGAAHHECLAQIKDPAEQWTCILPGIAARYLKSRIFPLEQLWSTQLSFCFVNGGFGYDPDWRGWHLQCDLGGHFKNSLHACVEYGWKCGKVWLDAYVKPYQREMLAQVKAAGFLDRPGNGLFMHSCHLGDEDYAGVFFNSILVNGSDGSRSSAQQALSRWFNGDATAMSRFDEPCFWNESYPGKPTGITAYQNLCNPTCPNVAY